MAEKTKYDEGTVKKEYHEAYQQGWTHWDAYFREATLDLRCVLGDQWKAVDKRKLKKQHREIMVFNKVQRVTRLVGGYQRKHRLVLKVDPIEGSDDKTASQLTGCLMWALQYSGAYNVLSEAFEKGALKTGINLVNPYIDYTEDPVDGDLKFKRIPYNRQLLDPNFSERDLSDCNFLLRRECFPREFIKTLIPGRDAEINTLQAHGRDSKFPLFVPPTDLRGDKYLIYDEFWVRDYKPIKTLIDPKTGAWTRHDKGAAHLKQVMQAFPWLLVVDGYQKTVQLRILLEGEVFYVGDNPDGLDEYPYVPIMGFWTPEMNESDLKLQALVRCIRDPQDETNKRRSKMLDLIDSQISSGFKAESDAVVDPGALYQAGQGRVILTKPGKFDKVGQLQSQDIPAGLFRLTELMDRDLVEIPGANEEMFGAPESQDIRQAGILSKLRQAAGLTVLQDLFDNYRFSKGLVGRISLKLIQRNFSAGKIKRIINEEPTKEFYNKDFGKYDCVPTEGILSDTQRQMYYAELRGMKAEGAPIPWSEIIDAAPTQWKGKLAESMRKQEAEMSKQMEFQKQMEQLTAALMQAKTARDIESAKEKTSQATENRANAALDRIKAAKEVGKMDLDNLLEILRFIIELEQRDKPAGGGAIRKGQSLTTR